MMPRLAALSISEKPVERTLASALPVSTAVRAFLSAERSRDFPARLRVFAFSACRCCFSADRVFAMNCCSYVSLCGFEPRILLRIDAQRLQFLPRQRRLG